MSSSRHNSDQPAESRRPRTRSESRHAKEGEFVSSEIYNTIQQEAEGEFNIITTFDFNRSEITEQVQREAQEEFQEILDLVLDSSSDENQGH